VALKLKFRTMFPAILKALSPLVLVKTGFQYVLSIDVNALKASFGNIVLGPVSSRKGNIAFYTDTTGLQLGADIAFNSGNPANSALYSQVGNPADGHALNYSGMQVSIGDTIGYGEQIGQGAAGFKQAVVGTVATNATDNPIPGPIGGLGGAYGVMGYAKGNGTTNVVGVGGYAAANVTNGNAWGANFVVHNQMPVVLNGGKATNWMSPIECDVNVWKGPAGAEMTHNNIFGLYIHGGGDSTTNQGQAIGVERLSVTTDARWLTGVASRTGAAITAFLAGPATRAANTVDSQYIALQALNGAGATITSRIWADSGGDLILQSPNALVLEDISANIFITAYNSLGGSGVQFNKLNAVPGLAVIGSTGVLNSTPVGAGVQTALGFNTNTAGSFVTNGGALGSPLSAGIMPAFGLGGNISGGGWQINAVIIGASTPGAGTFTHVTVSGTAGAGYIDIATQASGVVAPSAGLVRMGIDSAARVFYIRANGKSYTFDDSANTSTNRIYTLPDANGTVALTDNTAWPAYTPVLTSEAGGAIGTGNTLTGFWKQSGKTVFVRITIVIGASGMGAATQIGVSIPSTANGSNIIVAKNETSGVGGIADIGLLAQTKALLTTAAGGTLGGNSQTITITGIYEQI
jgi:hypothetical protein